MIEGCSQRWVARWQWLCNEEAGHFPNWVTMLTEHGEAVHEYPQTNMNIVCNNYQSHNNFYSVRWTGCSQERKGECVRTQVGVYSLYAPAVNVVFLHKLGHDDRLTVTQSVSDQPFLRHPPSTQKETTQPHPHPLAPLPPSSFYSP